MVRCILAQQVQAIHNGMETSVKAWASARKFGWVAGVLHKRSVYPTLNASSGLVAAASADSRTAIPTIRNRVPGLLRRYGKVWANCSRGSIGRTQMEGCLERTTVGPGGWRYDRSTGPSLPSPRHLL